MCDGAGSEVCWVSHLVVVDDEADVSKCRKETLTCGAIVHSPEVLLTFPFVSDALLANGKRFACHQEERASCRRDRVGRCVRACGGREEEEVFKRVRVFAFQIIADRIGTGQRKRYVSEATVVDDRCR